MASTEAEGGRQGGELCSGTDTINLAKVLDLFLRFVGVGVVIATAGGCTGLLRAAVT